MRSFLLVIAALAMSHRAAANHLAGQSPCSGHICSYAGKCVVVNGLPKCQCNKFYKPKGLACVSALSKRGVGTWYTDTVEEALADSKVGWYYTWQPSSDQQAISPPPGMEFVPQVTTEAYTTAGIALAAASGSTVLAFNEPDVDPEPGNEALTVTQALDRWPKLMAMKRRLGSCATAGNPSEDGSWQEAFMKGAKARGYRVDFLAVHYYGWDSSRWDTATAVADLRGFLEDAHAKFGKPIWVTEYGLIDWEDGTTPSWALQGAFAKRSAELMNSLSFVERYAWFSLPGDPPSTMFLYNEDGSATRTGVAYRAVP